LPLAPGVRHPAQLAVDVALDRGPTADGLQSLINVIAILHDHDPARPPNSETEDSG
jgi:hypothetical protein